MRPDNDARKIWEKKKEKNVLSLWRWSASPECWSPEMSTEHLFIMSSGWIRTEINSNVLKYRILSQLTITENIYWGLSIFSILSIYFSSHMILLEVFVPCSMAQGKCFSIACSQQSFSANECFKVTLTENSSFYFAFQVISMYFFYLFIIYFT